MSAESDVVFSRKAVLAFIHAHLDSLDNEQLGTIMNFWMLPRVYYAIVRDSEGTDDNIIEAVDILTRPRE